ncbi:MAG: hypothetical protein Q8L88_09850 [Bacteroidota bacterium]|nr:hypothetical protein [Bacteroidota bacterium]
MKTILAFIFTITFFPFSEKQLLNDNEHIKLELQQPRKISIAKSGDIAFFFEPIEGIHVNTNPQFELKLEKNSPFEIVGKARFQKNEKEYLDIKKPLEFSIKAKNGTKTGKQNLKGKLNYFYCSDKDGWCNRFSQKIDVTIEVIP